MIIIIIVNNSVLFFLSLTGEGGKGREGKGWDGIAEYIIPSVGC